VTLLGLAKLEQRLKKIPQPVKDAVKQEMGIQAAKIVVEMKSRVPADTGRLRKNIGWTWGKLGKGQTAIAQAKIGMGDELTLTIYAGNRDTQVKKGEKEKQLARYVEFGTVHVRAHPFFFSSWRDMKRQVKADLRKAVRAAVKKAATKS